MDVLVRRVVPNDAVALKAIRLAALADAPSAFGSTYAAEVDRPDEQWTAWAERDAAGTASATFLAVAGDVVVGLLAGYRSEPSTDRIELVSMWVAPPARRAGVAAMLLDAVVTWTADVGASRLELWVTRGNDAAADLYRAAGFALTGAHQPLPSDPCRDEIRMVRTL